MDSSCYELFRDIHKFCTIEPIYCNFFYVYEDNLDQNNIFPIA